MDSSCGALRKNMIDGVPRQIVGAGEVERPSARLGQRRPAAGNDDGFAHAEIIQVTRTCCSA